MPSAEPPELDSPKYLRGLDRERYAEYVHALYTTDQMSIREISRFTDRSFGLIYNLLTEYGTKKRAQGHQLGVGSHPKREGTEQVAAIIFDKKGNGRYGPIK